MIWKRKELGRKLSDDTWSLRETQWLKKLPLKMTNIFFHLNNLNDLTFRESEGLRFWLTLSVRRDFGVMVSKCQCSNHYQPVMSSLWQYFSLSLRKWENGRWFGEFTISLLYRNFYYWYLILEIVAILNLCCSCSFL